jgi:hypothetical protein
MAPGIHDAGGIILGGRPGFRMEYYREKDVRYYRELRRLKISRPFMDSWPILR